MKNWLTCTLYFILISLSVSAQEEGEVLYQGKRYISLNIKSLDKYNERVTKQQARLLKKLKSKENKYANKLKRRDSASYAKYSEQPLTYDSISKLQKTDSGLNYSRISKRGNASVDSLKNIQTFLQNKIHLQNGQSADLPASDTKLGQLKAQGNYSNYINDLISQRTNNLKSISQGSKVNIGAFNGISKQVFYAKEKMKVFKNMNDEPSEAEEMALESLQGYDGFDKYMLTADPNSMAALSAKGASASDLEKLGFQTKRQMSDQLQKKFGGDLGGLQQKMSGQINDFKAKLKKLEDAKNSASETKNTLTKLGHTEKPIFRPNAMRGLPLAKRIERQLNWQTTRATLDGQPAMFQLAAMAGFKHTPKLTYGVGLATSIGFGQSWNNIRFSFQGIGLRSYAEWKLLYGVGAYAGYERIYKQTAFFDSKVAQQPTETYAPHNNRSYNESVLIGLTKTYKVNDKWNGSMQVLYDVYWKEKGLRSPIILRIAQLKK
jgi:hypothetical protein